MKPSFLCWRNREESFSLLVPAAAIKRCRVSACDSCCARLQPQEEKSESMYLPTEPPTGLHQPPSTAELRQSRSPLSRKPPETLLFGSRSLEATRLQKLLPIQSMGLKGTVSLCKEDQKSKHLIFCFLLGFQDTALEDIKARHPDDG